MNGRKEAKSDLKKIDATTKWDFYLFACFGFFFYCPTSLLLHSCKRLELFFELQTPSAIEF